MGDPITMAMIGAGVGAVTNPRKPLQGALLGGALGGFGGAAMGAGNAAAATTMAGANPSLMGTAGMGSAKVAAAATPASALTSGVNPVFATPSMPTYAATGGSTGLIGSTTAPVTMMDRLKAVGDFGRQNPMVGQTGFNAFQSLNEPQPMAAAAQPGLMRGNPMPIEDQQMANFQPRPVSLI
jgi:hypothetical protein